MLGFNGVGTGKWELNANNKMGTKFVLAAPQTFDHIYALIRNDPNWAASTPIVRALVYNAVTGQKLYTSLNEITMPTANSPDNIYKWYSWTFNTFTLPAGTYILALQAGGYGSCDWQLILSGGVDSLVNSDAYADGGSDPFGANEYDLYKIFCIYAFLGGIPAAPQALFIWSPTTPSKGNIVIFDGSSSMQGSDGTKPLEIIEYKWNFGDGTGEEFGSVINHIFPDSEDYQVSLTVTDENAQTDTETHTVTILAVGVPEETRVSFEADADFELGIENLARCVLYNSPSILERRPLIWSYGGYTMVALQESLGGGLFDYVKFEPENYGSVPIPPIADAGTRCAKLQCVNPDVALNDELRRIEIFRQHDPYVLEKTIESWIYLPLDFEPDAWTVLLRASREVIFGSIPDFPAWAMLNIVVGIGDNCLIAGSDPRRYRLTTPVNHCTEPSRYGGVKRDYLSSIEDYITLGEWFKLKTYVYRHSKYGKLKVWLNDKLVFDFQGTDTVPITTMYIPSDTLAAIPTYPTGGGATYAMVASGINLYFGDANLHPKQAYFKNVTMINNVASTFPPSITDVSATPSTPITVGQSVSFNAVVVSELPYTVVWYDSSNQELATGNPAPIQFNAAGTYLIHAIATNSSGPSPPSVDLTIIVNPIVPDKLVVDIISEPTTIEQGKSSTITVTVTANGTLIEQASVTLSATGGALAQSGLTDANGIFTTPFTDTIAETVTITGSATKTGYTDSDPHQTTVLVTISPPPKFPVLEAGLGLLGVVGVIYLATRKG